MKLEFPSDWRFGDDGVHVSPDLAFRLHGLIDKIARSSENQQDIVEVFKGRLGGARSSNLSWSYSDLERVLENYEGSGAEFAEAIWIAMKEVEALRVPVPSVAKLNQIFRETGFAYEISLPNLRRLQVDAHIVTGESSNGEEPHSVPYILKREIGRGGFGVVHEAMRKTSAGEFQFALKLLEPSPFIKNPERARQRFERELKAVQRLQHRGIVGYIDAGYDSEQRPYIVMQFIDGEDIGAAAPNLGWRERMEMMVDVLTAIEYAHSREVFHRDLKPSNIMVRSSDRQPIIVDFGLCYIIDELDVQSLTSNNAPGTVRYIPPEVFVNPKDSRGALHDIYSCGVIAYELLASRSPNPQEYVSLSEICPDLSVFDPIIQKAISGVSTRYQTAGKFRDELRNAVTRIK